MFISNQDVKVTEVAPDIQIIRLNSVNGKIPGFELKEGEDLSEFENWVGASFLQIPR